MSETAAPKKRILSGVQPSGDLHIGNYLGALLQWRQLQHEHETFFCVVDLHALTVFESVEPVALREAIRAAAALYLAVGIDPQKATLFVQSEVRAHAELAWILTCATPMSWLHRMTQFKSKSENAQPGTGLFCYPALQAADILLYDTDLVPVGADQKQHIELARDIAERFNHHLGETFRLPEALIPAQGARIMGLDEPTMKMSKSVRTEGHAIRLLDTPKQIKKAINRAVTDTDPAMTTRYAEASPGVRNLLGIFSAFSGEAPEAIGERYDGRGYGYLKKDLIEVVDGQLAPIRERYTQLRAEAGYLDQVLDDGAARASAVAEGVMDRVRARVGIGRR